MRAPPALLLAACRLHSPPCAWPHPRLGGAPRCSETAQRLSANESAIALPALELARPAREVLRERAITYLEGMAAPSADALYREREVLTARSQRRLLVPIALSLLSLTQRRVGARLAPLVFFVARLATASMAKQPDPSVLVPWAQAARAGLRTATLSLEAVGLAAFSLLLAGCAACAAAELGARALVFRAVALSAVLNGEGPAADPLSDSDHDRGGGGDGGDSGDGSKAGGITRAPGRVWRGAQVRSEQLAECLDSARDASARMAVAPPSSVELPTPSDGASEGFQQAASTPPATPTPAAVTASASAATASLPSHPSDTPSPAGDAHAPSEHGDPPSAVIRYVPPAVLSAQLTTLARAALRAAAVHGALAVAAAVWALDAAFLLSIALLQRLRLLAIALARAISERASAWVAAMPRSREEATETLNYQARISVCSGGGEGRAGRRRLLGRRVRWGGELPHHATASH